MLNNVKYIGNTTFPLDENPPSIAGHQRIAELVQQLLRTIPLPLPLHAAMGEWL